MAPVWPVARSRSGSRRLVQACCWPGGIGLAAHTGRNSGDIVVRLYDKDNGSGNRWDAFRVATRHQLTVDEEMAAALRKNPSALAVSAELLPRALEFVPLLAAAARSRGHRLVLDTKGTRPTLSLRLEKPQRAVKISEEYEQVPHQLTDEERRRQRNQPWTMLPEFDRVPSGRLVLEINRAGYGEADTWTDDKRSTLEGQAQKIINAVDDGYLADQREREEWDRQRREQAERWERQQAEERAQWEQAKTAAAVQAQDKLRTDLFQTAFENWVAADAIRTFCAALERPPPYPTPPGGTSETGSPGPEPRQTTSTRP